MLDAHFMKFILGARKVTIDEMIIAFWGRTLNAVRIKGKPHPRGLKYFPVCDSKTGFCYGFFFHRGDIPDTRERIFTNLLERFRGQNITVVFDNFFSSKWSFEYC